MKTRCGHIIILWDVKVFAMMCYDMGKERERKKKTERNEKHFIDAPVNARTWEYVINSRVILHIQLSYIIPLHDRECSIFVHFVQQFNSLSLSLCSFQLHRISGGCKIGYFKIISGISNLTLGRFSCCLWLSLELWLCPVATFISKRYIFIHAISLHVYMLWILILNPSQREKNDWMGVIHTAHIRHKQQSGKNGNNFFLSQTNWDRVY